MPKQYRLAMKCFKQLIILSVSIFLLLASISKACDIILNPNVIADSDSIYLKDIAEKYPENIKNIFIAYAPYINNTLTITKTYIQSILKNEHLKFSICGNSVKIRRKTFLITKKTVKNLIKNKNIEIFSKMPIVLPYNNYHIKIKHIKSSEKFIWIKLAVLNGNKLYRVITISAKKPSELTIPVAKFDIRRGEIINIGEIKFAKTDSPLSSTAIKTLRAIVGKVAVSDIRQNQPFTNANTKREKFVKRGDLVKVEVKYGSIQISTIAKALRGGFKSDIIPIMYLTSKRVIVATIIGRKEVEVQ